MANTLKFGNGQWATGNGTALAYNDENANFKPLPFDFTRASSGTVVNQSGLIETVSTGIPRIDFQGNTKGALLLEPQRTNLIGVSADFSQASLTNGTVTTNNAISPDGTLDADTFICNTVSATGQFVASGTAGLSYTSSIYVKRKTGNSQVSLRGINNISTPIDVTNQWKRFTITQTSDNGTLRCGVLLSAIGDEVYVWGGQTEEGSYATSYIPTSGGAVTRVEDVCNNGGNAQAINSTEGVLYAEISALANDGTYRILSLSDGTSNERVYIQYIDSSNSISAVVKNGGTTQAFKTFVLSDETQFNKIAFKYKSNDFALWVNGVKVGTDTNGSVPIGLSKLAFDNGTGGNDFYGNVKDIRVYNTALTDQELQALTTI